MKSGRNDATLENCLLELLLNSLKAKATAIAIRFHVDNQKIQVVDNGIGITKKDLEELGEYFIRNEGLGSLVSTQSCQIIPGQSLTNIRKVSSALGIMSRSVSCIDTYGKFFSNDKSAKINKIENRPTSGTTVTVFVSRRCCTWSREIDSFAIRYLVICMALANTQVSFSVRDDMKENILLRVGKSQKRRKLLNVICEKSVRLGQMHHVKFCFNNFKIDLYYGVDCTYSRKIQQVFLNLRPVCCFDLEDFVIRAVTKTVYPHTENSKLSLERIFFLLYIECSESEYRLFLRNNKLTASFIKIDKISDAIQKSLKRNSSTSLKPSKLLNYKSVIPPIICQPMGRILGLPQKESFLKKMYKRKREKIMISTKRESKNKRYFRTKNHRATGSKDFAANKNTGEAAGNKNVTDIKISRELHRNNVNSIVVTQKYIENSKVDIDKPSPIISANNCIYKNDNELQKTQKCVEKLVNCRGALLPILENKNTDDITSIKSFNYNTHKTSSKTDGFVKKLSKNLEEIISEAETLNTNNLNTSLMTQKSVEKLNNSSGTILLIPESKNANEITSVNDPNPEIQNTNLLSERRVEESKNNAIQLSLVSRSSKLNKVGLIKEYNYENHGLPWISQRCMEKSLSNVEETYSVGDFSQWSDWNYESVSKYFPEPQSLKETRTITFKRFRFLPLKLHALLPFGSAKLISKACHFDNKVLLNLNVNRRRQDFEVRPCIRRSLEFKLKLESLKSMKVLNQVNREFIVAMTKQDGKKLLLIIDQHAMDERIRYENLLRAYKRDQKNQQFISLPLKQPIIISDLPESVCDLLSTNRSHLTRYGLSVGHRNKNTLLIYAVPRCFLKKKYNTDNTDVEVAVRKLLEEILDNLTGNGTKKLVPFTIHDAIASEACHGAIKFGDPLTAKQCKSLVSCWKDTDAPNRCAHGRPSVIPLMELPSYKRNRYQDAFEEKLNFASLRKRRRITVTNEMRRLEGPSRISYEGGNSDFNHNFV